MIVNDKINIKLYREVEHSFFLPNNLDLFSWSFPFLADKVTEMLYNIISKNEHYSPKKGEVAHPDDVDFKKLMEQQVAPKDSQAITEK
mgnify:CR=1 FL=1